MIHYHGTPFSGSEAVMASALAGRHALVSFKTPAPINIVSEVCQSFVLDNGAFSFWRSGKTPVNWAKYYDWVDKWHRHPAFDWALIPDVIDGDLETNKNLINQFPYPDHVGVPVWHMHEPVSWLAELGEPISNNSIALLNSFYSPGINVRLVYAK